MAGTINTGINLHHVRKIEKTTEIFEGFTVINLLITDKNDNCVEFKLFDNDNKSAIVQIDHGVKIHN